MLLFTEAHLEYNAGLVISSTARWSMTRLLRPWRRTSRGRLALVSRARPPVNPSDAVISGTLFTPFVGIAMQTALDLCMVWSLYGLYMCKHFWPSPSPARRNVALAARSSGHGNPIPTLSPLKEEMEQMLVKNVKNVPVTLTGPLSLAHPVAGVATLSTSEPATCNGL